MKKLTLLAGALATIGFFVTAASGAQAQDRHGWSYGGRQHERGSYDRHHGDYVDRHRGFYVEDHGPYRDLHHGTYYERHHGDYRMRHDSYPAPRPHGRDHRQVLPRRGGHHR